MIITKQNVIDTQDLNDGGKMTVVSDGTLKLGSATFDIHRYIFAHADETRYETHLVGKRGAQYLLRPYLERHGDSGLRQIISLNSGAPLRQRGNEIKVIEIAGVIEQLI